MSYIITINSESPQALAFLEYAKSLDFTSVTKENEIKKTTSLTAEQSAFKQRMRKNLEQIELLKQGKLKTQPLETLLETL